ncbi:MAG: pseudouridine synthase [Labilibaculum sp.]|nr:pseudouridine synthase [Labilibaculum sp.]MBI9059077.1 pseudouridine synthase [Labilibaculum sp.]
MEEKKYGKERRDRASFGSKKDNERRPDGRNPRFNRDSESRDDDKEGKSEFPRKRRESSDKPYQRDDSRSRSPRKFEDSDRRTNRSDDSRSPRRSDDDRSGRNSDRRRGRSDDSRSRSPRRDEDDFFGQDSDKRRHRRDQSNPRFRKDSNSGDRSRRNSDESNENQEENKKPFDRFENKPNRETLQKKHYSKKKQLAHAKISGPEDGILRLNKFISNTGACSRREADIRIADGRITVNNRIVTEVGTKVNIKDVVCMDGKQLQAEAKVYLVLNKPKDFVTTLDDPMGRKTVLDLIKHACDERVYPVGRLDRMTTGVLLFTNDGDLTKRLTHPSYNKKKIYHVFLDREISQEELDQVSAGLELEDGEIKADAISFADSKDKKQVGIEIHSGRNRIVRRIFEHLGYEVEKLDRVFFAGITKKNIPRGKWRFLSQKEVQMLKIYS